MSGSLVCIREKNMCSEEITTVGHGGEGSRVFTNETYEERKENDTKGGHLYEIRNPHSFVIDVPLPFKSRITLSVLTVFFTIYCHQ